MNISALNAPATPPYDYHNHTNANDDNNKHFYYQQDQIESSSDNETVTSSAFRRVSPMSMPSPPELLIDSSEDEEDDYTTPTPTYFNNNTSPYTMHQKRKSVPYRSPSNIADHKSIVFQINSNNQPKVLTGGGVLWSLRQRVSMARHHQKHSKNRLSAPRPERRVRAMRIQIPRPQWSRDNTLYDDLVSPVNNDWQSKKPIVVVSNPAEQTWQKPLIIMPQQETRKKSSATVPRRKNSSHHASSGRPARVKGPCQACHETSDGCMRKAFNWPFPTSTIFNDKGKPFVYLCNKCGLR
jgi:hypothetical protein